MRLHSLDMRGMGRTVKVSLFLGDNDEPSAATQWLEATVEVPVQGTMDPEGLQAAAMTILRDALNAEIASLRADQFG